MKTYAKASASELTRVVFVLIPRFNMMTLTTTIEPMRIANYLAPETLFEWEYRSCDGGEIVASNGMSVASSPIDGADGAFNIAVVCGSWGCEHYDRPGLFNWLRRPTPSTRARRPASSM